MEQEIIVRGEAEARALPDRAVLHVAVRGEGPGRDEAYASAAADAAAVDAVLRGREGALDRVSHTALVVQPTTRWRKGANVRTGWQASRTSTVEVVGLDVVGELLAELTGAGADVGGPEWQVDPGSPVHAAVRRAAAADARARAADYASALGLDLGPIAWVAEPGLRGGGEPGPRRFSRPAATAMAASAGPPEETIDVSPAELTVTAAVEVGFRIGERPGS